MSVHASVAKRRTAQAPAAKHAVLVFLTAFVVTGAGCAWAVLAAPAAVRQPLAWGGGATAVALAAAVTAAVYYAETLHRSRGLIAAAGAEADQLKLDLTLLAEETVPLLVRRLGGRAAGSARSRDPLAGQRRGPSPPRGRDARGRRR